MNELHFNPYKDKKMNIGFIDDHNVIKVIFDDLIGDNWYLRLQQFKTYQDFPLPNKSWIITQTYTNFSPLTIQLIKKDIALDVIEHTPVFTFSLNQSIPASNEIKETVHPVFKSAYDKIIDTTNEIERKLKNGEFTPNIQVGNVITLKPNQKASVIQRGDKNNPIFDFSIPQGKTGNTYYATFEIINSELIMTTPNEYDGVMFKINERGELEGLINANN